MKVLISIGITAAIFFASIFVSQVVGQNVMVLIVVASAVWIAFDMRGRRLKSNGFPKHPVVAAICVLLLWIVAFPWYLSVR